MFKSFCHRNATVSEIFDGKSKNKNFHHIFFLIPMAGEEIKIKSIKGSIDD